MWVCACVRCPTTRTLYRRNRMGHVDTAPPFLVPEMPQTLSGRTLNVTVTCYLALVPSTRAFALAIVSSKEFLDGRQEKNQGISVRNLASYRRNRMGHVDTASPFLVPEMPQTLSGLTLNVRRLCVCMCVCVHFRSNFGSNEVSRRPSERRIATKPRILVQMKCLGDPQRGVSRRSPERQPR